MLNIINSIKIYISRVHRNFIIKRELENRFPGVDFPNLSYADPKCKFIGKVKLSENVKLFNCIIGHNTYLAANSKLHDCEIGKYCSIGPHLLAGLGMHPSKKISFNWVSRFVNSSN